uniref:hypothetical protein n=1 Tax=Actinomadura sp. CA-154981 TaxID=3240037 RepID=UPI003F497A04
MRIRRTLASLAATALILVATGAAGRAAYGDQCAWRLVAAPAGAVHDLGWVDALSKDDVRFTYSLGSGFLRPWVLSSDGRSVGETTQMTPLGDTNTWVTSSSFDSADSGWMLLDGLDELRGVGARWHKGRWTMTPLAVSPDAETTGVWPVRVVSISPTDAWAVGSFYKAAKGTDPAAARTGALTEHWDGTRWRIVPNPADSRPGATLMGLVAVSPTDAWAVGWEDGDDGKAVPLTLHWDGTRWSIVPVPAGYRPSGLRAVGGTGPRDIWAVGSQTQQGADNTAVPMVVHWNGTSWTEATGLPDIGNARVDTVYAASPKSVWATIEVPDGVEHFLHYDGRSWKTVPVPGPRTIGLRYFYQGIDGTGPNDIWAAGLVVHQPTARITPQIAHYSCGRRWT